LITPTTSVNLTIPQCLDVVRTSVRARGGVGLKRLTTIGLGILIALLAGSSTPALAQRAAEAKISGSTGDTVDPKALSADLAKQSLKLLRRGEDSHDPAVKSRSYTEGLMLARQAVAADDENADAHFAVFANMGRLMLADGATPNPFNLLRVNRELDRTLELNPHHSDALASKGGLARQLPRLLGGSLTKAERYLREAIAVDPNAVGARIELARTYRDMGREADAVPLLEKAATIAQQQGKIRELGEARALLAQLQPAN
jgi:tetratricopeptide (TPR) repeat protein